VSQATPSLDALDPEFEPLPLDEDRARDQLGAAEELHYLGHAEPAMEAAGTALAAVLRLRAGHLAGHSASLGALLEALRATGALDAAEHEILCQLLRVHDRLTRGYVPDPRDVLFADETGAALATMVNLLEADGGASSIP
jgi:hypothetical protein